MTDDKSRLAITLTLALLCSCPAAAATVWNEATDGPLSENPLAPTVLSFAAGPNDVIGSAGQPTTRNPNAPWVQDFLTFTVPTGYELRSVTPVVNDLYTPGDVYSFIGIQSGATFTHSVQYPNFGGNAAGLLGWLHVPADDQGVDILPAMGKAGEGAIGFTPPLGAGQYAVWIQDNNPFKYDYRFDISAVPEPPGWIAMLIGFAGLAYAGSRRRVARLREI